MALSKFRPEIQEAVNTAAEKRTPYQQIIAEMAESQLRAGANAAMTKLPADKKKQHEAKRKQHVIQVKEIKFRPNTDDHDYDFKKNHAIRFLKEGNRVKAVVQFRGREIAHVDLGKKLLLRGRSLHSSLAEVLTISTRPAPSECSTSAGTASSKRARMRSPLPGAPVSG